MQTFKIVRMTPYQHSQEVQNSPQLLQSAGQCCASCCMSNIRSMFDSVRHHFATFPVTHCNIFLINAFVTAISQGTKDIVEDNFKEEQYLKESKDGKTEDMELRIVTGCHCVSFIISLIAGIPTNFKGQKFKCLRVRTATQEKLMLSKAENLELALSDMRQQHLNSAT